MKIIEQHRGFIERAEEIWREILQIYSDAEYWNKHVRKRHETSIDPDPKGELGVALKALNKFIGE